ncbi:MAG: response regulator [Treponema sp.]|nr:response regulator [Treponema sp.]
MPYGRVLVVDDIETNLDVARGLLLPYGLAIDCASGGSEAIEKIRAVEAKPGTEKYDLIFMDYMMPGMDGIEAVRIIRNEIGSVYARTVPIIALTANAIKGNEELFLSRGFNAYITKPIDIFRLDAALNVWIRNKQTRETLDRAESEKAAGKEEHGAAPPDLFGGLSVPGIDLAEGKKRYSNDAAFLEIIRSYCVHTPSLLEKIRVFSEEAPDQYTIAVHGLKGSSYGICADEAGNYAAAMEAAARAGDIETIKAKNSGLITTVETLISGLNEVLAKTGKNRDKKQRAAPDPALLDRLLEACKQYRLALMEEAVTELEKYEYDSGGNLVVWLREQLDSLEYDAMQDFLENRNSLSQTVKTQLLQEGNYGSQKSYTGG